MSFRFLIPFLFAFSSIFATWFDSIPRSIDLPNGKKLECFITGDQYARRLHDANNYTLTINPADGYFYYAKLVDGDIAPSEHRVGDVDPRLLGLDKGLSVSQEVYKNKKRFYNH